MNNKQLSTIKLVTSLGFILGFLAVLMGFIGNGINHDYFFAIGLGIMISSILTFGFFLFISSMEEVSGNRQRI
ncbi:hypothetical protein ACFSCX_25485 [Bacillus salitolerans]|uniref:Uncharacterized protein n=1 Tax=Bacillus salitolerans TaxID=1437434 RepID=A0ABW4LXK1_9BACI